MKVKIRDIARPLRFGAFFLRTLPPFSRRLFALSQSFIVGLWKGKCNSRTVTMTEMTIQREDGTPLRLCVYRSKSGTKPDSVAFVWYHGGGYAMGIPELEQSYFELLCSDGSCVIVSPDYRLTIEEPYPASAEDCYTATQWVLHNAKELGTDGRVFIGGNSAGGGLTAAVSLMARDRGLTGIAHQFPLFPMLDDRTTDSMRDNNAPMWNERSNIAAWQMLLAGREADCYAAPARASSLSGLPPATSFVGDVDPFVDETTEYFRRLSEAGVPADLLVLNGCFHGFDTAFPKSEPARRAREFLISAYKRALSAKQ